MNNVLTAHRFTTVLKLRQLCDARNSSLVSANKHHLTHDGVRCLWEAIDRTVRYADWKIFKEKEATMMRLYLQHYSATEETDEDSQDAYNTNSYRLSFR